MQIDVQHSLNAIMRLDRCSLKRSLSPTAFMQSVSYIRYRGHCITGIHVHTTVLLPIVFNEEQISDQKDAKFKPDKRNPNYFH